jgi:hypothetical protein
LAAIAGEKFAGFLFGNDGTNGRRFRGYEKNLVRLIRQLRQDFNSPNAKFVVVTLGKTKKGDKDDKGLMIGE